MNGCPVATKFLHGCSLKQVNRIREAGVPILKTMTYGTGKSEVFVLEIPEHRWQWAKNLKYAAEPRKK